MARLSSLWNCNSVSGHVKAKASFLPRTKAKIGMRTSLKFNPQSAFTAAFAGELMETEQKKSARPHTTAEMLRLGEKSSVF